MRKFSFIAVMLFLCIAFTYQSEAQTIGGKNLNDIIKMDPAVTYGQLDNGLVYYIRENNRPENRAELQILFKAGSIDEDDDQKGLAHFLEHMLFNGTENFPKNDLISFLESTGMRFGADVNASTGFDRTYYLLTIPMDKPDMLEKAMLVLQDWAKNTTLDPEEIEKERGVIMEEWLVYRGANERIQRKHFPVLLYNSKFADRLPIGDTAIIRNAQRAEFERFYRDWYRPNLTAVIAVGDFDKNDIENRIKNNFSQWQNPKNERERIEHTVPYHKERLVSIAQDKELQFSNINIIYKHEQTPNRTYGEYRLGLIDQLINVMINERLGEITKKPNPPFLVAQSVATDYIANIKAFLMIAVPGAEGLMPAFEAVTTEAYRLKQHGFTNSELSRAKTQLERVIQQAYNERDRTESVNYTREYYEHYMKGTAMPGVEYEKELFEIFLPTIEIAEVNKIASAYIIDENLVITVSAPEREDVKLPSESELLAVYDRIAKTNHEPLAEEDDDKPLMANLPKPGSITKETKNDKLGTIELELSNGAKAILKKTDFKNDEIMMRAYSKGGSSLAGNDIWLSASNASGIVNESGLGEFNSIALQRYMTGKIANVSPMIGELTEGFMGNASPDDLETMFQLLHLYFTAPRKDKDAFDNYHKTLSEVIRNSRRSPDAALRDTLNAVLGNYHPRSMAMTDEDLKKIDLEKAFKFYQERYADAGDFTYIFVGNFDENKMKEFVKTYIASLPNLQRNDSWKDLGIKPPKGKILKEVKKGIEPKSSVRIVIHNEFEYNPENRLMLQAMTEVFSIRLREVIREELGGVYGIAAFPRIQKFPSPYYQIFVYFGTSPERVDELIENVNLVIDELKDGKLGADYIGKVQEILKRERETSLKENRWWLNQIYTANFEGFDLAVGIQNFDSKVDALTPEVITKAAKQFLDKSNYLQVVLNPED